ncbi:hypothetical protein [Streptomyces sp. TLI_105]|nr:hypothetical protein [Streptomyces sp. TLI_105]
MRHRGLLEGMRRTEVDMWNQAKEVTRAGMTADQLYAEYRPCPYEK